MLNKLPETLSFEEGASFLIAFTTALHALRTRANLQTQEHVLITGAGGGVGLAAVAVAAHLGAKVVAAATSFEKRKPQEPLAPRTSSTAMPSILQHLYRS